MFLNIFFTLYSKSMKDSLIARKQFNDKRLRVEEENVKERISWTESDRTDVETSQVAGTPLGVAFGVPFTRNSFLLAAQFWDLLQSHVFQRIYIPALESISEIASYRHLMFDLVTGTQDVFCFWPLDDPVQVPRREMPHVESAISGLD